MLLDVADDVALFGTTIDDVVNIVLFDVVKMLLHILFVAKIKWIWKHAYIN